MKATRALPTLLCLIAIAALALSPAAEAKAKARVPMLHGNPSNKRLASEFLLILQAQDMKALKRFLAPEFLIQRGDGSYLNKRQYLRNPAKTDRFKIRHAVGTRKGKIRVVRYDLDVIEKIHGSYIPQGWVPRLSTFVKRKGAWRLVSHANFLQPPTG